MSGFTEPYNMEHSSGRNSFDSLTFVGTSAMYLKFASPENGWKLSVLKLSACPHSLYKQLGKQSYPTETCYLCRGQY